MKWRDVEGCAGGMLRGVCGEFRERDEECLDGLDEVISIFSFS